MAENVRRGVLLRLPQDTLDRIDIARGALNRTQWILNLLERELQYLSAVRDIHPEEFGPTEPVTVDQPDEEGVAWPV